MLKNKGVAKTAIWSETRDIREETDYSKHFDGKAQKRQRWSAVSIQEWLPLPQQTDPLRRTCSSVVSIHVTNKLHIYIIQRTNMSYV